MNTPRWPIPVSALSAEVAERRSSLRVPEGEVHFTYRTLRGSSRAWIMAEHGNVIVGSSMGDAQRKLASAMGYGLNDIAGSL